MYIRVVKHRDLFFFRVQFFDTWLTIARNGCMAPLDQQFDPVHGHASDEETAETITLYKNIIFEQNVVLEGEI